MFGPLTRSVAILAVAVSLSVGLVGSASAAPNDQVVTETACVATLDGQVCESATVAYPPPVVTYPAYPTYYPSAFAYYGGGYWPARAYNVYSGYLNEDRGWRRHWRR